MSSPASRGLDRRTFLGAAGAAAGAVVAAAALPLSTRAAGLATARPTEPGAAARPLDRIDDGSWDIDDQWGHAPRYAHPIPHSPARTSPIAWELVDPVDRMLVI